MNVFTGWTGWATRAVLRYLGIRVGAPRDHIAEATFAHAWRERDERRLRGEFTAAAERLYPDGDDNQPWPCSHEDRWCVCTPQGRHHAPVRHVPPHQYVKWNHCDRCYATFELTCNAPSYGPEPVVGHCEWSEDMTRRFAE